MTLRNEKGAVLIMTLFVLTMLVAFSAMFLMRSVNNSNATRKDLNERKAFYVSEGGGHAALKEIDRLVNTLMFNTINDMNPSTVISLTDGYFNAQNGLSFLVSSVVDSSLKPCSPSPSCSQVFSLNGSQAEYSSGDIPFGEGQYKYDIIVTQETAPVKVSSDIWQFFYNYRAEATGSMGSQSRMLILNGDFTVTVQRDNFAKYALFTNNQQTPSGSNVWFTSSTNFSGPIHTNNRFNIYGNPSGTFEGAASQSDQTTRFYNNGWTVLIDDDHNGTRDVPVFNAGFTRGADAITLASPVQEQDLVDQALGGETYSSDGIYVPNDGVDVTGGIYVRGSSDIEMQLDGGNAKYKIVQGATTKYVIVDIANNQTTIDTVGGGTDVYSGLPNGIDGVGTIIYATDTINSFKGTVQGDTSVTVASASDIIISDNILYSNYTSAVGSPGDASYTPPSASGYDNLLGIVSWGGDVRIGTSAPDDVSVHGTILASNGILTVDNYSSSAIGPRGVATLLGGVISDSYGAFGTFSGSTGSQVSGYGRNFVYDGRMVEGSSPPYFPTLNTFVAYTPDITDKIVWQEGGV